LKSEAPGPLELVRQFVNTTDLEEGWDRLDTPEGLESWLEEASLAGAPAPTEADVARFADVREGLRALLFANNAEPLDERAAERLDRVARDVALRARFKPDGALEPVERGPEGALGVILATVYGSMQDGTWSRLKACRADTCQWAFYDRSRNRSGTWCSMEVCGNRAKARSYRRRQGARAPTA
jgi:predicted RNA-binding Zn ribbon-like protein